VQRLCGVGKGRSVVERVEHNVRNRKISLKLKTLKFDIHFSSRQSFKMLEPTTMVMKGAIMRCVVM
jgi:hypothetical protein